MLNEMSMLVRVFKTEEYMEQFLDGKIFMNTIGYFKKYEESERNNVTDHHEGAYRIVDPNKLVMSVNGEIIDPKNIIGPVVYSHQWTDRVNAVCLTIINPIRIRTENCSVAPYAIQTKCIYGLPDGSEKLGTHAIILTDIQEFVRRMNAKLDPMLRSGEVNEYRLQPVTYYDESGIDIHVGEFDFASVFFKNSIYAHQQEYRVALERLNTEVGTFTLEIGSLRDVCISLESSDRRQFSKVL